MRFLDKSNINKSILQPVHIIQSRVVNCTLYLWRNVKLQDMGDRLQRPHYLSRLESWRKIRSRRQWTDIGKYSLVNRTIQHWNQLPAEVLGTLPCKPVIFKQGKKGDNRGDLKEHIECWKSSRSVEIWRKVKWKSFSSVVKWYKVKRSEVKCSVGKGEKSGL